MEREQGISLRISGKVVGFSLVSASVSSRALLPLVSGHYHPRAGPIRSFRKTLPCADTCCKNLPNQYQTSYYEKSDRITFISRTHPTFRLPVLIQSIKQMNKQRNKHYLWRSLIFFLKIHDWREQKSQQLFSRVWWRWRAVFHEERDRLINPSNSASFVLQYLNQSWCDCILEIARQLQLLQFVKTGPQCQHESFFSNLS